MRRIVLCAATLAAAACGGRPATVADPTPCGIPDLPNCAMSGNLTFGGQPSPAALKYFADQGYTTVVSTRGLQELNWDERAAVEALGLRFVQIPMEHPVSAITDAEVAALDSVLGAKHGPVLLHCASGNRAGALWGAWLADRGGVDRPEALRLAALAGMKSVRPVLEQRLSR